MSKVEGGGPIDPPPSRLHVNIFSGRLLGLINPVSFYLLIFELCHKLSRE